MKINVTTHTQPTETIVKHSLNNVNESLIELKRRIKLEGKLKDKFVTNFKLGNYHFDLYAPALKIAIQIDAYSYAYSDIYNLEKVKYLSIPHKNITVLKISDYQILVDCDEIIRFLNNYIKGKIREARITN